LLPKLATGNRSVPNATFAVRLAVTSLMGIYALFVSLTAVAAPRMLSQVPFQAITE
jgi:hypothetical protein